MKRALGFFGIVCAIFVGVFAALRLQDYLRSRPSGSLPVFQLNENRLVPTLQGTNGQVGFDFRSAVKKVLPSVVSVDRLDRVRRGFWDEEAVITQTGGGSGVIVSNKGYILTNNHVVERAAEVHVRLHDQRSFTAEVVGTDPRSDLAVLKINAPNLVAAEMGDSSALHAIGTPLGYANTVSAGIVSSLNRTFQTGSQTALIDSIQTDAAINQGNSGGPLTNAAGQVVGINTIIVSQTGGSVGLGFAIPINRAQKVVDDIVKYGRVRYGYLGASVYNRPGLLELPEVRRDITQAVGSEPPKGGLIVRAVNRGSAAGQAGLQQLDVLLAVDGKKLEEPIDLTKALIDKRPGERVKIQFWSKGQTKTAEVALSEL
jgi:serine protease Do